MLTQSRLKELLHYCPETGVFTRLIGSRNGYAKKGQIAGHLLKIGYLALNIGTTKYYCHRLAFLYMTGEFPNGVVDHINCIQTDNRFCNLRVVTKSENFQNLRKSHKDNKSGFLGVIKDKKKWCAQISIQGKRTTKGGFDTPEEAHICYVEMKRAQHTKNTL